MTGYPMGMILHDITSFFCYCVRLASINFSSNFFTSSSHPKILASSCVSSMSGFLRVAPDRAFETVFCRQPTLTSIGENVPPVPMSQPHTAEFPAIDKEKMSPEVGMSQLHIELTAVEFTGHETPCTPSVSVALNKLKLISVITSVEVVVRV